MISREEILKGQVCPPELEANLVKLLQCVNLLRAKWGRPMIVTSGFRDVIHNATVGGRTGSAHLTCEAVDFSDPDNTMGHWLRLNQEILRECGLYIEHPDATLNWLHVQTRRPKSGNRVFWP